MMIREATMEDAPALARIGVDTNRAFYERLGAREVGSRPLNWEGYETRELLYGWEDISKLMAGQDLVPGTDRL